MDKDYHGYRTKEPEHSSEDFYRQFYNDEEEEGKTHINIQSDSNTFGGYNAYYDTQGKK
jgi:hypothetical protein